MLRYTLLFLIVTIFSCGESNNKSSKESTPKEKGSSTKDKEGNPASLNGNFYKRLEGQIAGQDVVVHYSKFEDKMFFNYYYVSQGIPIGLYANSENKLAGDSIELIEYDLMQKDYEHQEDNKWHIIQTENGIKGIWISRDGKKTSNISLKENYPTGSSLFNIVGKSDSSAVYFKEDTAVARTYMMMMEPSDASVTKWFSEMLIKNFWSDETAKPKSLSNLIETETKSYIKDYKAEIDTMRMNGELADTGMHYMLNYENQLNSNAFYNDNGFVVLDIGSYGYYGGAHGIQGTSAICFDVKEKKVMVLEDILSIDSLTLQKIVEKNFKARSGLKPNEPMTEVLFENKLPANDNFYFTNKGLGFIYQPYEVAAYAFGIVNVFIPYNEVRQYLNPQFALRMGLQ